MTDAESRRHRRYEVKDVQGTFLFDLQVKVLNLSVGGMAVETNSRLKVGRRYSFRIQNDERVLNVHGYVAWSVLRCTRRTANGDMEPVYQAGIRFDDVLTDSADGIRQLIEDKVVLDVGKRIFGRFHMVSGTSATLNSEVAFAVRKISLSGMLVESNLVAELNTVFDLEITLANGLFRCEGRIAYVDPVDSLADNPRYRLGVEFRDVSDESQERLEQFITFDIEAEPPS